MRYFFLFSAIFISTLSNSQTRTYRNEFLNTGAGARAFAMSGSTTAGVSDETATYWNPAGLQNIQSKYSAGIMHAEYFAGMSKYDFASLAYKPSDSTAFAFSIVRMGTDDIPNTLDLVDKNGNVDYDRITYFSVADYALLLAYAKKSKIKGLSYGVQTKIIYRHLGTFANAYGFGFDAGVQYKLGNWTTGLMLKDATSTFNAWFFDGQRNTLLSSKRIAFAPHIGFEGSYLDIIFVRAGVGNFTFIPDFDKETLSVLPAIGLGVKLYDLRIDYALTDIGNLSGALYSNIFSLSYEFGTKNK